MGARLRAGAAFRLLQEGLGFGSEVVSAHLAMEERTLGRLGIGQITLLQ